MTELEWQPFWKPLGLGIIAVALMVVFLVVLPMATCSMCKGKRTIDWVNLDDGTPQHHVCFWCNGKGRESIFRKWQWELQARGYIAR